MLLIIKIEKFRESLIIILESVMIFQYFFIHGKDIFIRNKNFLFINYFLVDHLHGLEFNFNFFNNSPKKIAFTFLSIKLEMNIKTQTFVKKLRY